MKKFYQWFLIYALFLVSSLALAETCPSIKDIKQNRLDGWTVHDSEEGTPLSRKQVAQFTQNIENFALAEWRQLKKQQSGTAIHCFYRDKSGSNMEAYLAKPNFTPDNSHNRWYSVSGSWHCAANGELCGFKKVIAHG